MTGITWMTRKTGVTVLNGVNRMTRMAGITGMVWITRYWPDWGD